ncbi:hypothetical protein NQ318_000447 [Aromia moschata]|uniref:Carboxylic ester hydrolase n=1 Tax=Aromia moschata TaxID=1265417 RepID=A0AAV8YU25_9CUCU|nr:hypothetical protein NQ318_000447 [Aromia moschata]
MRSTSGLVLGVILLSISGALAESAGEEEDGTGRGTVDLLVKTTAGWVRGEYGGVTRGAGKTVYRFRSIPFAEPPVGNLRFEAPVPKTKWSGVLDVSSKGAECTQGSDPIIGSEDCLFVKVYTTEAPRKQKNLPVMVWIYGGAFFGGAPDFDDHSPDYLLDEGVIVVSFHYRVGILGFLSTGDLAAPGNAGLKDQVLALKWIKENIASFGGNPDRITVFGQSAGAASVSYLLQTPQTAGLYNGVILQSGSSLNLWALSRVARDTAFQVAENLDLDTGSSQAVVDGLKSVDAETLQNVSMSTMTSVLLSNNPRDGLVFTPVIEPDHDGAIVTKKSHQLLSDGEFNAVPVIIGYTSLEALLQEIPALLRVWLLTYDVQPSRLVPINLNIASSFTRASVGLQVKTQYFGLVLVSTSSERVMKFISDDQFVRPIQETARRLATKTPVYFYRFAHEGTLWGVDNRSTSEADYLTRRQMVRLWTNFAKTGNPTPTTDSLLDNVIWEPNTGDIDDLNVLEIDHGLAMTNNPNQNDISFWQRIYSNYGNPPHDTY